VLIENKTKVASGVGCSERAVLYFILEWKSDGWKEKKSCVSSAVIRC